MNLAARLETLAPPGGIRISQDAVDELAVSSQRRWAAADEAGRFTDELAPVEVKDPVWES